MSMPLPATPVDLLTFSHSVFSQFRTSTKVGISGLQAFRKWTFPRCGPALPFNSTTNFHKHLRWDVGEPASGSIHLGTRESATAGFFAQLHRWGLWPCLAAQESNKDPSHYLGCSGHLRINSDWGGAAAPFFCSKNSFLGSTKSQDIFISSRKTLIHFDPIRWMLSNSFGFPQVNRKLWHDNDSTSYFLSNRLPLFWQVWHYVVAESKSECFATLPILENPWKSLKIRMILPSIGVISRLTWIIFTVKMPINRRPANCEVHGSISLELPSKKQPKA